MGASGAKVHRAGLTAIRFVAALALLVAGALVTPSPPAHAETSADVQRQIDVLLTHVRDLQGKAALLSKARRGAVDAADVTVSRNAEADRAVDQTTQDARTSEAGLGKRVRGLYMSGGPLAVYATLLGSSSLTDLADRTQMSRRVLQSDMRRNDATANRAAQAATLAQEAEQAVRERMRVQQAIGTLARQLNDLLDQQRDTFALLDTRMRALKAREDAQRASAQIEWARATMLAQQEASEPGGSSHAAGATDADYDRANAPWGPDVSGWQHPGNAGIDWAAVRGAGASFAFVKVSEGVGYTSPYFAADAAAARAQGLYVGGYHFARPRLPLSTAVTEADYFLGALGDVHARGWLPPVLDLEETGGLKPDEVTAWARIFLRRVQARTGRVPIVYTGGWFWQGHMNNPTGFAGYPLWDSRYLDSPTPGALFGDWTSTTFWQYTWQRSVPGITGGVDASYFHAGGAELAALANDAPPPP